MNQKITLVIQALALVAIVVLIQVACKILATTNDIKTAIYGWEEVNDVTQQTYR